MTVRELAEKMRISIKFEPRDIWIGTFVARADISPLRREAVYRVYICLVPMFPIVISRMR